MDFHGILKLSNRDLGQLQGATSFAWPCNAKTLSKTAPSTFDCSKTRRSKLI